MFINVKGLKGIPYIKLLSVFKVGCNSLISNNCANTYSKNN